MFFTISLITSLNRSENLFVWVYLVCVWGCMYMCFRVKSSCPTNFITDLRKAMKVLISSTQRSGPSGQSNLLLKPFPPEIPWKQGDSVTKVMRYDIIYKGSTSVQFSFMSNQMKERVFFSMLWCEHILSCASFFVTILVFFHVPINIFKGEMFRKEFIDWGRFIRSACCKWAFVFHRHRYQQTVSHSCLYTNAVHTVPSLLADLLIHTEGKKRKKKRGVRWLKFVIQIYREMSFATYLDIAAGNHTVAYLLHGGDNTVYTKQNQSKWNGWYMENERTGEKDMQRKQDNICMHLSEDDGILSIWILNVRMCATICACVCLCGWGFAVTFVESGKRSFLNIGLEEHLQFIYYSSADLSIPHHYYKGQAVLTCAVCTPQTEAHQ